MFWKIREKRMLSNSKESEPKRGLAICRCQPKRPEKVHTLIALGVGSLRHVAMAGPHGDEKANRPKVGSIPCWASLASCGSLQNWPGRLPTA